MTKKIVWRLKESPSTDKLSQLVKDGILTKDEAREILFSSEEITERDIKSYQEEIKFLRELVEKLSQSKSQIVKVIEQVNVPYIQYRWYPPYEHWTYSPISGSTLELYSKGNISGSADCLDFNSISTW